jgi:hypothetical protein
MEHPTCSMCGWAGPRHKMMRHGGDAADWAKLMRWGSPRHSKWACRDTAACQERQAQRKDKAGA